jgi:adenine-specific DNA-methyltransferase
MKDVKKFTSPRTAQRWANEKDAKAVVFQGDCEKLLSALPPSSVDLIVTSPPYCMGKAYEKGDGIDVFVTSHDRVLPMAVSALKPGGSLCWQVGFHVKNNVAIPLDFLVYQALAKFPDMRLRNRIVWTFGHGLHCNARFSGRHETVLWYTKGENYTFDLDAVRIAQKYPGKTFAHGPNQGKPSGNPAGKNPSDVWDIPNVKANHMEKTAHPCQFPVGLAQRLVRALSKPGDLVLDPFCGVASAGVAALVEDRRFLGAEIDPSYVEIAIERLKAAAKKTIQYRSADRAIHIPTPTSSVVRRPAGFAVPLEEAFATQV